MQATGAPPLAVPGAARRVCERLSKNRRAHRLLYLTAVGNADTI